MAIELIINPREKDLGGFSVKRILPFAERRMVGPFIFFDHMGPAHFEIGDGIDVRPHPHIGLATVTYLFEGEIIHRDTLGSHQAITPGAVNWMTAGKGIAHSERTGVNERGHLHNVHGIQSWVALPKDFEECEPEFFHHASDTLPEVNFPGVKLKIILGSAYGAKAPVKVYSPIFYAEAFVEAGATLELPNEYSERAVYVVEGNIELEGQEITEAHMAILSKNTPVQFTAKTASHVMILGGEPFSEPRYIYWNFVSSSKERLEKAKLDWYEGRFPKIPGDDKEFIPLPEIPKPGTVL